MERTIIAVRSLPCVCSVASSNPPGMMATLRPERITEQITSFVADSSRPETSHSTYGKKNARQTNQPLISNQVKAVIIYTYI